MGDLFLSSFTVVITLAVNLADVLRVYALLIIFVFSALIVASPLLSRLGLGCLMAVSGSLQMLHQPVRRETNKEGVE